MPDLKYFSWFVRSAWGEKKLQTGGVSCQLPFVERKTMGASLFHIKFENQRKTIDKLIICLVHAQHLKTKLSSDKALRHFCCTCVLHPTCVIVSGLSLCECVYIFVYLHAVTLHPYCLSLLCWFELVYAAGFGNPLNAVIRTFYCMFVMLFV